MPMSHRVALGAAVIAAGLASAPAVRAIEANLPTQGVDDAIVFARMARHEARQAFHDRYARTPGGAVSRISIVSEYRRVVLRTEEKIRLGDRSYSVRQLTTELEPWRGQLEVIVDLVFHPMNTYVGVPLIDVLLAPLDGGGDRTPLVAETTDRIPRFGGFFDPPPPDAPWWPFPPPAPTVTVRRDTVTGGWVLARFDATRLASGRFDVVVKDGATSLGSASFDFGALR
ncbi:MAG: hypothetical protein AB7U83_08920 [Vicinamibacterales bacterium]